MKNLIIYTGLLLLLLSAVAMTAYAAEQLTLEQAIETALKNNPGLKAADAQVEAAQAGITRSRSELFGDVEQDRQSKLNQEILIRLIAGILVFGSVLLGLFVHPGFFMFMGFVGLMFVIFYLDRLLPHEYYSLRFRRARALQLLSEPGRGK